MELDALNLIERFGRQVTLATIWATDDRDILYNEKIVSVAITARDVTDPGPWFAADFTDYFKYLWFAHFIQFERP